MNKIYSKIWSKALGRMVVASELASSDGARSAPAAASEAKRNALAVCMVLLLGLSGSAWAADAVCVDPVTGQPVGTTAGAGDEVACGEGATASGVDAVAVGSGAMATGINSIGIGNDASSGMSFIGGGIAIGTSATAADVTSGSAIAIGSFAQASSPNNLGDSLAIGTQSRATGQDSIAIGGQTLASGTYAIAIGNDSTSATGRAAISTGVGAHADGDNSIALGADARANNEGDVALGWRSVTAAANPTASTTINGTTYNFAGATPTSVVSVGAVGSERQITNVAAGRISATSTDAINGSQLHATNQAVDALGQGWTVSAQGANGTNVGVDSATGNTMDLNNGDGNIVVTKAADSNDVTFDLASDLVIDNSITVGDTYIDGDSVTTNNLTVTGDTRLGDNFVVNEGGVYYDGPITEDTHIVNKQYVDQYVDTTIEAARTRYYSVNDGGVQQGNYANNGATGMNSMAAGPNASASAADGVALGNGASASTANSVALGAGSATGAVVGTTSGTIAGTTYTYAGGAPVGTVSVGSAGAERTITHVAAGRVSADSTDAVNGSQLYAAHQAIEAVDQRVTEIEGDIVDLGDRVTNVEGDVANLTTTVNEFDNRITNVEGDVTSIQNGADGMFQVSQEGTVVKPQPTGTNSSAGGNGAVASGNNAMAVGNQSTASGDNSTAIGQGATASHDNSVALGQGSATTVGAQTNYSAAYVGTSTSTGEVNIGGRTISGVAPGRLGTDAVNVNQLNAGVNYAINQANQYTDNRISQIQNDVWTLERGYRGATASAMAMAGLPQAYLPGKSMLAVGVGGYQGEYGMAVGLSGITDNGRYVYKAQASGNTSRDWGFSVGAGIQW